MSCVLGSVLDLPGVTAVVTAETEAGAENRISLFWWLWNKLTCKEFRLRSEFKADLITYYRENESMIPVAPLVEEHKVPIEDLYALPPMWANNKPYRLDKNQQTENETPENHADASQITTVSEIFLSGGVRYKKIYITANAGFGKTSLSQKLTMTWCQAHSPLTALTEKYNDEELAAMKCFDYLFLLHLRDYPGKQLCNLDKLIMQMLSNNLSRNTQYTKYFLQGLLHEKMCLILLDGLDEWAHSDKCRRTPAVPHNNHPDSCTVLTTSRPWKLGAIGLSEHNIDRHIEIAELNCKTRCRIEENAIRILNERNLNLAGKSIADFDKEVRSVEIGQIIYIPYILLQLISLFFSGLTIGKSKCETYSNIIEFTLKRGLKKTDLPDIHLQSNDNAPVPNCMKKNKKCNVYVNLIIKLGKLAFCALFNEKKESSLIFGRKYAKQYMTEEEIEFCLKVGQLCQTKDSSIIAKKRYQIFFQHKSVQEFFAAIYITSEWQNESVKSTILNVCLSLSGILEMSNLFVFVCGINPEVYACISGELQKILDLDGVTGRCNIGMTYDDDAITISSYQSVQMRCLQESMRNGNESCPVYLYVTICNYSVFKSIIFFNETSISTAYLTALKKIIHFNKGHVRALLFNDLSEPDNSSAFLKSLDPGVFTSLETLKVIKPLFGGKEPSWLAVMLTESARTLKCLVLSLGSSKSDIIITALTELTCLQSLDLRNVYMTHNKLKCLYAYISMATTLTQLSLVVVRCSDHIRHENEYCDCDVTLDLHQLYKLELVKLIRLIMSSAVYQKLLLSVCGLPHPVTVELSRCEGPSRQEWQTITNVIKSKQTISILQDLRIEPDGDASLTLKNKTE